METLDIGKKETLYDCNVEWGIISNRPEQEGYYPLYAVMCTIFPVGGITSTSAAPKWMRRLSLSLEDSHFGKCFTRSQVNEEITPPPSPAEQNGIRTTY